MTENCENVWILDRDWVSDNDERDHDLSMGDLYSQVLMCYKTDILDQRQPLSEDSTSSVIAI
jgi:hypothetical protein